MNAPTCRECGALCVTRDGRVTCSACGYVAGTALAEAVANVERFPTGTSTFPHRLSTAIAEARDEGHEAGRREALYLARLIVHGLAAPDGGTFPPGSVELHDHVLWFLRSCGLGSAIDGNRIGEAEAHRALAGKL